jgi:hypothetical protein
MRIKKFKDQSKFSYLISYLTVKKQIKLLFFNTFSRKALTSSSFRDLLEMQEESSLDLRAKYVRWSQKRTYYIDKKCQIYG